MVEGPNDGLYLFPSHGKTSIPSQDFLEVSVFLLWCEENLFLVKIPRHPEICERGGERRVLFGRPWPPKFRCDGIHSRSVVGVKPWVRFVYWITEEYEVVDPFDDVLDPIESKDSTNTICAVPQHRVQAPGTETSIVVNIDGTIEVEACVNLVFGRDGHAAVSGVYVVNCGLYKRVRQEEDKLAQREPVSQEVCS
jgi:hypothetical protein